MKVENKIISDSSFFWERFQSWFQKKRLEMKQFFFVTFVVLDTQIERPLMNVKITVEPIMVRAVLKLARKLFTFQVHQCCQRKNSYSEFVVATRRYLLFLKLLVLLVKESEGLEN
jgi:hypothetical protein